MRYSRNASASCPSADNFARSVASAFVALDGARLAGQKWPAHFGEALKVGNHRFEQFIKL